MSQVRHFLADDDLTSAEQAEVLTLAAEMKRDRFAHRPLNGPKSVAVLFDKTSTRTRFSFAAGIAELGGNPVITDSGNSQMGAKESYQDTGSVLSRWMSAIVWRTYAHANLEAMCETATVPVINALSDDLHPCQILADLQTCIEHLCPADGPAGLSGKRAVYFGDGDNNMANSYLLGFATAGMDITIIAPDGFQPQARFVDRAKAIGENTGATINVTDDIAAAAGAQAVITDTWVSMGMEGDGKDRHTPLVPYQVTPEVMASAAPEAIFLHCLPAYRGSEVAAEVIDGPQSVVFDEAENRLHAQKALLAWLLEHQEEGR